MFGSILGLENSEYRILIGKYIRDSNINTEEERGFSFRITPSKGKKSIYSKLITTNTIHDSLRKVKRADVF